MIERVLISEAASQLVDELKEEHGSLIFHQSGGCCDGSAPMCFPEGDLMLNDSDIKLGEINGCSFYMSADQFNYWKHTQLTIDVVNGRGASFSVEIPRGVRFVTKSRLFTAEEMDNLAPVSSPA